MPTKTSPFPLELGPRSGQPLFARIADALARDIARGRLRAGMPLPGARTLALSLGVHRSTVMQAYDELEAQGWLDTHPGRPHHVAKVLATDPSSRGLRKRRPPTTSSSSSSPSSMPSAASRAPLAPPFDLAPLAHPLAAPPGAAIGLWGGVPDPRLAPAVLLARAYRRVTRRPSPALFSYAPDALGHPRLRAALVSWIAASRGVAATAQDVIITRGSQMAIDLVARALLRPGDVVAVEALGYPPAFRVFERSGARLLPIPVDQGGLDVDALVTATQSTPVKLLYVTPQHHYPTTVMLTQPRRARLWEWAARHRVAILEDDYDQEFHYGGRPVLPLAATSSQSQVIYMGTLSKIVAPALRLGFVVAAPALIDRLGRERFLVDRQGDALLECAVAELFEEGEIPRLVRRNRRIYESRRDALCEALTRQLGDVLTFQPPAGGLAAWTRVHDTVDLEAWQAAAAAAGVPFQTGRHFTVDGSFLSCARFGFALADEKTLTGWVARLRKHLVRRKPATARRKGRA